MEKPFTFEITYFKPHGKYYTSETVELNVGYVSEIPVPLMWQVKEKLKELKTLPGLTSKSWRGPVVVTCSDGYPIMFVEGITQ